VAVLLAAGADPNDDCGGDRPETPLHWAASTDDVGVAAVLVEGGADLETPGGSIGTPLDNAIGYRCWHVARLLVARGATVDRLWHAAALGMLSRTECRMPFGSALTGGPARVRLVAHEQPPAAARHDRSVLGGQRSRFLTGGVFGSGSPWSARLAELDVPAPSALRRVVLAQHELCVPQAALAQPTIICCGLVSGRRSPARSC
jgi:hypothetical protein